MERKPTNEELAQQAIELLSKAEDFELQRDWAKAIEIYNEAAEFLKNSGFFLHRINEIFSRIAELNNYIQLEMEDQEYQPQIQNEQIKSEAKKIKSHLVETSSLPIPDFKAEALKGYKREKIDRDALQNRAFALMDQAKKFEKDKSFDKAIINYQEALELLNSLGWGEQTKHILNEIERLKREKKNFEKFYSQEKDQIAFLDDSTAKQQTVRQSEAERKDLKRVEFEEMKKKEEAIKIRAFKLIDTSRNLEREMKYDEAIIQLEQVIDLFKSILWEKNITPIMNNIKDIREKQKRDAQTERSRLMRLEKLENLSKSIQEKKRDSALQAAQKVKLSRKKFDQKRLEQLKIEKQFFALVRNADRNLHSGNYNEAIDEYQKAIQLVRNLGIGWESYISKIQATLTRAKQRRKFEEKKDIEIEEKREEIKQLELKFYEQLSLERERLKLKDFDVITHEDEIEYRKQCKQNAFKFLTVAQEYTKHGNYDKAIYAYQNAGNIFAEIQWTDELPQIENAIKELQNRMKESNLYKLKTMNETIERQKKEKEFQSHMSKQLLLEQEKLRQKEVSVKEYDNEVEARKKIKNKAFNLLEDAGIFMKNGLYDQALECYRSVELNLNEIQFPTDAIRDMIEKVQKNKIKQEEIQKKEQEFKIQEKVEEKKFNQQVAKIFEKEKERLEAKEIQIQETSEFQALLKEKKEQAFEILDDAENFIKSLDYDNALGSYRKAELIMNEIHYPTEAIKGMIAKIINIKKQKELEEHMELQRELERIEQEHEIQTLIEDRQKEEEEKKRAQQLALKERERLIQEQRSHREAAYSLLEEGAKFLKGEFPDYEATISLYIQAREILEEKIGWELEINNINDLIEELQVGKANFIEKKRREVEAKLKRQKEYEEFQEEIRKRELEYKKQKEAQEKVLEDYKKKKELEGELRTHGLYLIDEGKKMAKFWEFDQAYEFFNKAKVHFKKIGWDDQIRFIESQIKDTKNLEERVKKEEITLQKIQNELKEKKILEDQQLITEDKRIKQMIGEVGTLTERITKLMNVRKEELKLREEQSKEKIKHEAKDFSATMAKMIKLKEEIQTELAKKEELIKQKQKEEQEKKEKEELDEIKRMIREMTKKKKE